MYCAELSEDDTLLDRWQNNSEYDDQGIHHAVRGWYILFWTDGRMISTMMTICYVQSCQVLFGDSHCRTIATMMTIGSASSCKRMICFWIHCRITGTVTTTEYSPSCQTMILFCVDRRITGTMMTVGYSPSCKRLILFRD